MKNLAISLFVLLVAGAALAAVPQVFNYQGYLSDLDGVPLEGDYNIVFRIYDVATGADPALWTETHTLVPVHDGVFSVLLGSLVALPPSVLENSALWIGVTVGTDTEIAPRLQVTSTPWAYRAAIADSSAVTGAGGGEGGTVFNVATGAGLTGGPITTSGTISIAGGGVTNSMLANNAVTGANISDNSITAADIATNAVGASEIAANAVGASEIASSAVGASELASNAVSASKIAANAVASSEILDGSVRDIDIQDEPGVASVRKTASPVLTVTPQNVASRSITHPAAGYIVATTSCYGRLSHTSGTASEITISISSSSAVHNTSNGVVYYLPAGESSGTRRTAMATCEVFPVAGSGTTTFYLVADADVGTGNYVYSANLVLMYFPTSYGTVSKAEESTVDPDNR